MKRWFIAGAVFGWWCAITYLEAEREKRDAARRAAEQRIEREQRGRVVP